jgi:hypothetical protein
MERNACCSHLQQWDKLRIRFLVLKCLRHEVHYLTEIAHLLKVLQLCEMPEFAEDNWLLYYW